MSSHTPVTRGACHGRVMPKEGMALRNPQYSFTCRTGHLKYPGLCTYLRMANVSARFKPAGSTGDVAREELRRAPVTGIGAGAAVQCAKWLSSSLISNIQLGFWENRGGEWIGTAEMDWDTRYPVPTVGTLRMLVMPEPPLRYHHAHDYWAFSACICTRSIYSNP